MSAPKVALISTALRGSARRNPWRGSSVLLSRGGLSSIGSASAPRRRAPSRAAAAGRRAFSRRTYRRRRGKASSERGRVCGVIRPKSRRLPGTESRRSNSQELSSGASSKFDEAPAACAGGGHAEPLPHPRSDAANSSMHCGRGTRGRTRLAPPRARPCRARWRRESVRDLGPREAPPHDRLIASRKWNRCLGGRWSTEAARQRRGGSKRFRP
jgi:hypothetical protein